MAPHMMGYRHPKNFCPRLKKLSNSIYLFYGLDVIVARYFTTRYHSGKNPSFLA